MIVSDNNLLNILSSKNNPILKQALQNADMQTLKDLESKQTTVSDILKNLFEDLKAGNKSNNNIENLLKNSNVFKDLGNFSNSLKTLLQDIQADPKLEKFKPLLQSFLTNIKDLDENTLKESLLKSGVFLEAKIASGNSNLLIPKNLETVLNDIKAFIKQIPNANTTNINSQIDKILNNINQNTNANMNTQVLSDIKNLITSMNELSSKLTSSSLQNLNNLTNNLVNITANAQLYESKSVNLLPNNVDKQNILTQTKEILVQVKNEVLNNATLSNKDAILKVLNNALANTDLFSKDTSNIEAKTLLNSISNSSILNEASKQNPALQTILSDLKSFSSKIQNIEQNILSNQIQTNEKINITNELQNSLLNLKSELSNIKNLDTSLINKLIDKILNLENLFSKINLPSDLNNFNNLLSSSLNLNNSSNSIFSSNFLSNINEVILNLKQNLSEANTSANLQSQNNILKFIDKLEVISNNLNFNLQTNAKNETFSNSFQNDIKTVLLQMQKELDIAGDSKSSETLKQVERMLTQIDYHQLLSLASKSNSVYLPFIWDMMEEGSIAIKEKENKFYCQINLKLKEFGDTSLLLALYDKNKLDMTIYASKENFKEALKENITKLKQALNSIRLIPMDIKIIDLKKEEESVNKVNNIYESNNDYSLGLDIRV